MGTYEETVFQLILHGGNGRSYAMEAIAAAKKGDFITARNHLQKASEELHAAHHVQTSLIQNEANGKRKEVTLLMIHAQDHLMNAITLKELAAEFVDLYESLQNKGGRKI
ncbi:PTS lactose/cellobiose transporter subunit IIA [Thermaerobacillus caldiproteolyticus]|uniref:PTS system cellobiose-specific IIA component n=1 Tax=Thermaerobacillus caldiproteolyticus TaxID=247480 RepID=A0A7V9Z998_9BACL|nr:PTS lactose/cellobiose transporter subunit IIA [Anoxybacillus caldiproteolyticus]MBA2876425.1 PTS system cellobiose-specific IIA component [Anoxybacillus caldiproteolyticus]